MYQTLATLKTAIIYSLYIIFPDIQYVHLNSSAKNYCIFYNTYNLTLFKQLHYYLLKLLNKSLSKYIMHTTRI